MSPDQQREQRLALERFHQLVTGSLDGELTPDEEQEFEQILSASPERRREWAEHQKLKNLTMNMKLAEPPPEVWDCYWTTVYRRLERGIAWVFVSVGAMIVLGYAAYYAVEAVLADHEVPWPFKAGMFFLAGGAIVLFVSVMRERWFAAKTDKYKEIQR